MNNVLQQVGKSCQSGRLMTRNTQLFSQALERRHLKDSPRHCAAFSSTTTVATSSLPNKQSQNHKRTQRKGQHNRRNRDPSEFRNNRTLKKKGKQHEPMSANEKSTLSKCNDAMSTLLGKRRALPPPPIDWLYDHQPNYDDKNLTKERMDLYKDILSLIQAVELSIKAKKIQASSGREIRELTALLGNILLVCSESPPKRFLTDASLPSTSQSCTKVLSLLHELNLDIQHIHNFCTIRAANQEHEWELASSLFQNQIDPDFQGLVPVDTRLGWDSYLEMGLFSLTMNLVESGGEGVDVVERVLDAVRDMCMVSPTDREKYLMAAGAALGRSGQWKACVDYMSIQNDNTSEFGQPLFAAMMNACYMCEEYDSVLDLYYNMEQDSQSQVGGGDWQWEGEYSRSHPLCTDLLLRSVGRRLQESDEKYQNFSEGASLTFYQLMEQGGRVSIDAIKGILQACENDLDYERALEILKILKRYDAVNSEWKIVGEAIENFLYEDDCAELVSQTQVVNDDILATIMKTCNDCGEYGVSLLCMQLDGFSQSIERFPSKRNTMVDKIIDKRPSLHRSFKLLECTVVALQGLGCSADAHALYSRIEKKIDSHDKELFQPSESTNKLNPCWHETYDNIDRLLFAAHTIQQTEYAVSKEEKYNLSLGTARMLNCAIEAGQINAGIEVAKTVASALNQRQTKKSMKDTVKSFFGLEEINAEPENKFWFSSDELFAATIKAHSIKVGVDDALATFHSNFGLDNVENMSNATISDNGKSSWIKTINTVLQLLVRKGDFDKAKDLFDGLSHQSRTSDSYLTMANGFKEQRRWNEIGSCYFSAKDDGCLSEELCILTMESIAESTVSGKVKVLRSVAKEAARMKGMKDGAWIFHNYWVIKRHVGFHYARLLMWWNDPNETQQQEFRIASQHLSLCNKKNLRIDFDAITTIIELAGHQEIGEKGQGRNNEHLYPPSVVYDALLKLHEYDNDEKSKLLSDGLLYLSKTNSKTECAQYLKHIEYNGLPVDEQQLALATATARLDSSN